MPANTRHVKKNLEQTPGSRIMPDYTLTASPLRRINPDEVRFLVRKNVHATRFHTGAVRSNALTFDTIAQRFARLHWIPNDCIAPRRFDMTLARPAPVSLHALYIAWRERPGTPTAGTTPAVVYWPGAFSDVAPLYGVGPVDRV